MLALIFLTLVYIFQTCPFAAAHTTTATATTADSSHQNTYLDVKPVNTTWHLEVIQALNISNYRLSYDRDPTRVRIGAIGPQLAQLIPDAVDLVPKRVIPPVEKGEEPTIFYNVPVVNDHILFMYGIGATKELAKNVEALDKALTEQLDRVTKLYGETTKLEHIFSKSSDGHAELRMRAAEAEATKARIEMEIEIERTKNEEEYLKAQSDSKLMQLRRNEKLTLERLEKEDEAARVRAEEAMRLKFESSMEAERVRVLTGEILSAAQYERDLALQRAAEDMKAKTAKSIAIAKAEAERANEDVHIRKLKAEADQRRHRNAAAINAIATHLATSFTAAAKNPKQSFTIIGYIALFVTGLYTAKEIARLCRVLIESLIGKPKLIRETTRQSLPRKVLSALINCPRRLRKLATRYIMKVKGRSEGDREAFGAHFDDVILPPDLKNRILSLASSARKVRQNDAPHRHVLFYGPPGTGKTLVARKLARCIGMEYAFMSGGDVGPLGPDAVTQIHNLFTWAKFCRKGVLLFIDEAEAFLGDRSTNMMDENAHNALNALLYNTGSERTDFMMVLATNRAEDLDAAILDRCDETLLFPRPNAQCRFKLLTHYFNTFVRDMERKHGSENKTLSDWIRDRFIQKQEDFKVNIQNDVMNASQIAEVVLVTKNFSGREIAKLIIALQGSIYASKDGTLTPMMVKRIVDTKVSEHWDKHKMVGANVLCPVADSDIDASKDTVLVRDQCPLDFFCPRTQDCRENNTFCSKGGVIHISSSSPAVNSSPIIAACTTNLIAQSIGEANETFHSEGKISSKSIPYFPLANPHSSDGVRHRHNLVTHNHEASKCTARENNYSCLQLANCHPPFSTEGGPDLFAQDQEKANDSFQAEDKIGADITENTPDLVAQYQKEVENMVQWKETSSSIAVIKGRPSSVIQNQQELKDMSQIEEVISSSFLLKHTSRHTMDRDTSDFVIRDTEEMKDMIDNSLCCVPLASPSLLVTKSESTERSKSSVENPFKLVSPVLIPPNWTKSNEIVVLRNISHFIWKKFRKLRQTNK